MAKWTFGDSHEFADDVQKLYFHQHRGVLSDGYEGEDYTIAFANDSFITSAKSRAALHRTMDKLIELDMQPEVVEASSDGRTWIAIIKGRSNVDLVNQLIWDTWFEICGIDQAS
jgi:hypothetical protein